MGKLGIILAFLLSVAAAGGSFYLYQGWVEARTVRGVVEAKYDQVKEKMITVQSEKDSVAAENAKLSAKSEELRTKTDAMQLQVKKLKADQARVDAERAALQKKLEAEQQRIAEMQAKMTELEQKASAACSVTPADLTGNPLLTAQTVTTPAAPVSFEKTPLFFKPVNPDSSVKTDTTTPTIASKTSSVTSNFKQEVAPPSQTSSAVTQTSSALATLATGTGSKVLTVNRKFNFVVVNLGMQDGIKMGDRLKVFKQGQQVATVQVEKLYDKFSAATLLEEDPKQQVIEGDEIVKA
jgi:hypothetical protein